ncbi:hypothetical protein [Hasllibacter sp. MH4015]|uniref:hypothetical protein n=1 Tax=Hasllibacter sp. MH4015 TaxID=2854029 RepID=UPI001CD3A1B1|nr:hypothetical protein [Hasllibacter sp. MH4015]
MKRLALATALIASVAAPAFADGHTTAFAIMHFNMSEDSASDRRMVPVGELMMADLTMDSTLSDVFRQLNMSVETMSDLRGETGFVTVIASDPAHGAEIFERLRLQSLEDE